MEKEERLFVRINKKKKDEIKKMASTEGLTITEFVEKMIDTGINSENIINQKITEYKEEVLFNYFDELRENMFEMKRKIEDQKHQELKNLISKDKVILTVVQFDYEDISSYKAGDILELSNDKLFAIETIFKDEYVLGIRNLQTRKASFFEIKTYANTIKNVLRYT